MLQVLFDFKEYDAVCSILQNRQRQPSLLGSSALIPHATLASLRYPSLAYMYLSPMQHSIADMPVTAEVYIAVIIDLPNKLQIKSSLEVLLCSTVDKLAKAGCSCI